MSSRFSPHGVRDLEWTDDKEYEKDRRMAPEYERPSVVDYGTLVDITRNGTFPNKDVPAATTTRLSFPSPAPPPRNGGLKGCRRSLVRPRLSSADRQAHLPHAREADPRPGASCRQHYFLVFESAASRSSRRSAALQAPPRSGRRRHLRVAQPDQVRGHSPADTDDAAPNPRF